MEVDPELVIPDPDLSIDEGAVAPWAGGHTSDYFGRLLVALAETMKFRTDVPWRKMSAKAQSAVLYGVDKEIHVRYRNRYGRQRSYHTRFEGVIPYIERRHAEAESEAGRPGSYCREHANVAQLCSPSALTTISV